MNLLMCAYACEPNRGSEHEVGWRWLIDNSKKYSQVTLVTRTKNREIIEVELEKLNIKNIDFICFDIPKWIGFWKKYPMGIQFYAYLWELLLFIFLLKRIKKKQFDVSQRVTFVSYRFPTLIWYFSREFIFGPVSGGERFPLNFLKIFSVKGKILEIIRLIARNISFIDPLVQLSIFKANKIIAVTEDTKSILPSYSKYKTVVQPAISINEDDFDLNLKKKVISKSKKVKLLYVGRLLEWKGIKFILKAVKDISVDKYEFNIIGSGKDKHIFENYVNRHKLNVNFLGQKSRNELSQYYFSHDLFVFPSLHDSGGMVVLEAKAHGLPVLVGTFGGPQQFIDCNDILIKSRNIDDFILEIKMKLQELVNEKD